ncbi:DNA polymerase III subunit gamma/tau [Candidatus Saccharibacteria bacterium]|nr:DNA polymerase III subunit gamma/tau [Candidatus Saccharibacteria bacterium]MCL1962814.1 DNA polymerase III subunit gamma/tau [Candidatus Saccharibacteria bacterium]
MSERGKSAQARLALYRKYRSRNLDEIIGQPQVTDILKSVAKSGKFAHAYLFTGQRGTGKTSVARILAHLINGTEYGTPDIDIIEIDAASNNGVDDVRELRDNVNLAPMHAPRKIYIIDEVHMLSSAAFNALLKTIEEPPAHVVFILATTEIHKMPATILSRVQRFHFRPVAPEIVAGHLRNISDQEKIDVDDDALLLIAERGGGSFRDSITLLDQLSGSAEKITHEKVEEILGLAPESAIDAIVDAVVGHDAASVISMSANLHSDGIPPEIVVDQLIKKLSAVAVTRPRLYDLVEKLLDVTKSTAPDIKLLAILVGFAAKGSAVATPITMKANVVKTKIDKDSGAATTSRAGSGVTTPAAMTEPRNDGREGVVRKSSEAEAVDDNTTGPRIESGVTSSDAPAEITWSDILSEVKNLDAPAVLSTLRFASFDYADGVLTLYFDKTFHRKNAEKANFRDALNTAFQNLYKSVPQITVAKIAKPASESEDSDIAQIAAIMGGGEILSQREELEG